jgi:hypothetical protein
MNRTVPINTLLACLGSVVTGKGTKLSSHTVKLSYFQPLEAAQIIPGFALTPSTGTKLCRKYMGELSDIPGCC